MLTVLFIGCTPYLWHPYPAYAFVLFATGGYFAVRRVNIVEFFARRKFVWLLVGMLAIFLRFVIDRFIPVPYVYKQAYALCRILEMPLFWAFANEIAKVLDKVVIRKYIMPGSFFLYCSHIVVNSLMMQPLGAALPVFHGKMLLMTLFLYGAVICFCLLMYNIAKRYFPRMVRLFDGTL